jgi:Skp family chaperone for outer membrane proteins
MNRSLCLIAAMAFAFTFWGRASAQALNLPDGKTAIIYSDAFLDAKTGIARFNAILDGLNREFQSRRTEIDTLQQKIKTLTDEIEKTASVADPAALRMKEEQLQQMRRDLQRKGEDAQAAYERRKAVVFAPLQQDVAKALELYAKAHNIILIFDASQVPLIYAANGMDITRAFINDFNSKNPVTPTAALR